MVLGNFARKEMAGARKRSLCLVNKIDGNSSEIYFKLRVLVKIKPNRLPSYNFN